MAAELDLFYGTVAGADAYMANQLHRDGWQPCPATDKQIALISATRAIERLRYKGLKHALWLKVVDKCCGKQRSKLPTWSSPLSFHGIATLRSRARSKLQRTRSLMSYWSKCETLTRSWKTSKLSQTSMTSYALCMTENCRSRLISRTAFHHQLLGLTSLLG